MTCTSQRINGIDACRGLAIGAMILVNLPGSWAHAPGCLRHAGWHGCLPADLILPCFLYIAGVSLAAAKGTPTVAALLVRAAWLIGIGLCINASGPLITLVQTGHLPPVRVTGILQRIGLACLLAGLLLRGVPHRVLPAAAILLLAAHWALLAAAGAGLTPTANIAVQIDRWLLHPRLLYSGAPTDPEGLLATISAAVTILVGYLSGVPDSPRRLLLPALGLLLGGWCWSIWLPLNKSLWTGSFALWSAGWAMLLYSLCLRLQTCAPMRMAGVLGRHALLLFILAGVGTRLLLALPAGGAGTSIYGWLYRSLFAAWTGARTGSLLFSLTALLLLGCVAAICEQRGWRLHLGYR